MTIRDYSATAGDNTAIEGIGLSDAMLANALDNAIRQQMADSANFLLDIAKPTDTTGAANVYALSTGGTVSAYADKVRLAFRANFTNTGAATMNVDTLGAVDLKVYTAAGVANPLAGQIQSGGVYDMLYVDALGDFVVLNPAQYEVELVDDTTPQLGGPLDTNSFSIDWSKATNVASATELLLLRDGNYIIVTGTTDIETIEDTADAIGIGSVYVLRFADALTLTYHVTNLYLPGEANIITATNDMAFMLKAASGEHRCIAYTKASGLPVIDNGVTGIYESTAQTITAAALLTLAHGLGVEPKIISYTLECTTADNGYSIGDRIEADFNQSTSAISVFHLPRKDATNIYIRFGNNAVSFSGQNKATGVAVNLTNGSWALYVTAMS